MTDFRYTPGAMQASHRCPLPDSLWELQDRSTDVPSVKKRRLRPESLTNLPKVTEAASSVAGLPVWGSVVCFHVHAIPAHLLSCPRRALQQRVGDGTGGWVVFRAPFPTRPLTGVGALNREQVWMQTEVLGCKGRRRQGEQREQRSWITPEPMLGSRKPLTPPPAPGLSRPPT